MACGLGNSVPHAAVPTFSCAGTRRPLRQPCHRGGLLAVRRVLHVSRDFADRLPSGPQPPSNQPSRRALHPSPCSPGSLVASSRSNALHRQNTTASGGRQPRSPCSWPEEPRRPHRDGWLSQSRQWAEADGSWRLLGKAWSAHRRGRNTWACPLPFRLAGNKVTCLRRRQLPCDPGGAHLRHPRAGRDSHEPSRAGRAQGLAVQAATQRPPSVEAPGPRSLGNRKDPSALQNVSQFFLNPGHFLVMSVIFKNRRQTELVLNRKTLLVLVTKNNY